MLFLFGLGFCLIQEIHAFNNALLGAYRHLRVTIVFIHGGNVIEAVFFILEHAFDAVLDNNRQLEPIARIVTATIGYGTGQHMTVTVLVL